MKEMFLHLLKVIIHIAIIVFVFAFFSNTFRHYFILHDTSYTLLVIDAVGIISGSITVVISMRNIIKIIKRKRR